MSNTVQTLLAALERNHDGASAGRIQQLLALADGALPSDYLEFLRECDGGEGFIGDGGFLAIWPVQEVLSAREEEIFRDAAWLIPFASDGSSSAYAFDLTSSPEARRVVKIGYLEVGDREMEEHRGNTFLEFLESIATERDEE